ncbi:uncharacterized protein CPUR_00122 [Claviceps purpurea 20.1]|uniref:Uncharacterized protein n=1 Tax=Claviceps purpurea (strain 20.1) TaxID=1111077 RepID=M1W4E3_CLAP2|nr:uncharacterized protein CPUR_00122 [Claviceps purpurea 20.1]
MSSRLALASPRLWVLTVQQPLPSPAGGRRTGQVTKITEAEYSQFLS